MKKWAKNVRKKLFKRARKLAGEGYSVLPLQGDLGSGEAKKPTIKWRPLQKRIARDREIETMFDKRAGALGVVCGQVSRALVIDFDDHLRYQRFCRNLPQYAETYTVKTRRGYHVYFRTDVKVPSHQFEGGDIKGEGSYVVAPPSIIAGFEYKAVRGRGAKSLDEEDVNSMLTYFHIRGSGKTAPSEAVRVGGNVDIVGVYQRLYASLGRNNALYRSARVGAQQGLSRREIEDRLLQVFVMTGVAGEHKYESYEERYREGRRTIVSAMRRAAHGGLRDGGVPNSARERLLQSQGSSVVARLLDIMWACGWEPERYFYMGEAVELGSRFGLDRKSVMAALTGELCSFNGRHIIARRYVEYLDIEGLNVRRRGRRAQLVFQMPSVARLLSVLGVSASPSDALSELDLRSGHAYRLGLHREYVRRLSPRLPMAVMARRLGISARTLRRYNLELGVQVCQRVGRFALTWDLLKCLPRRDRGHMKSQTPGYWLESGESRRFPAWRHVGAALLRRGGEAVYVNVRRASGLSLGKRDPRPLVVESMNVELFMRLRSQRGERVGHGGLLDRLREWATEARSRAVGLRYVRTRLEYDTVASLIAEDKVAESIHAYLFAVDGFGSEVRRPARRGVAYRMLKEFGEGRVYLAVRDSTGETLSTMARHALRLGDEVSGARLLARSMV